MIIKNTKYIISKQRLNEERKAEVEKRIEEERKIQEQTYLQSQNINENNDVEQNSSKIEKNGLIMDKGEFLKTFSEDYDTDVQKPTENNLKEELTSYEKEYYDDDGNYIIEIRKVIPADDVKEFNDVLDDYSDLIEDINE